MSVYKDLKPDRPLRIYYRNSAQFVQALAKYNIRLQRWINRHKDKDNLADKSIEIIKENRRNRSHLDNLFKKNQLYKFKQRRLV
jgi:hypothetical protein